MCLRNMSMHATQSRSIEGLEQVIGFYQEVFKGHIHPKIDRSRVPDEHKKRLLRNVFYIDGRTVDARMPEDGTNKTTRRNSLTLAPVAADAAANQAYQRLLQRRDGQEAASTSSTSDHQTVPAKARRSHHDATNGNAEPKTKKTKRNELSTAWSAAVPLRTESEELPTVVAGFSGDEEKEQTPTAINYGAMEIL